MHARQRMTEMIDWLERLELDGFVERTADGVHTTKRWQAAMSRAALQMYQYGETLTDLRVPIAAALIERYEGLDAGTLADAVAVMLRIESAELARNIGRLS